MQHYLAGFGFPDFRFELHPPEIRTAAPVRVTVGEDLLMAPRRWPGVTPVARDRLYRAAVAHAAAHLRYSPRQRPTGNRNPMLLAMIALVEDARVERLMLRQYPGLNALWGAFHNATRADAGFGLAGLSARLARALHDPRYSDSNVWITQGRQMFEQAAANLHDIAAFECIGRELAIRIEKMRLPFSAATHCFIPSYRDDNTLLWNLNGALPEDEHETVVREDFEMKTTEHELPQVRYVEVDTRKRWHYPEWDCKLEALRDNWATVIEPALPGNAPGPCRTTARTARSLLRFTGLERIPDRSRRLKRLHEGDELDLAAAVHSVVQRAGGMTPDPRIFMRHGRRRRSTAIVLLMDLSESTGRFVPGSFTTVLDIEKRAATLVAESLDVSRDRVAVHGFSSNGREEVNR